MDVEKIVNAKIKDLVESGILLKNIEVATEKAVTEAITSKIDGYSFRNDIKKQLSEFIDPALKEIDFSGYAELIKQRFVAILNDVMGKELANKASSMYEELFKPTTKPIKISEIFESIKEDFKEEDSDRSEGKYYLQIEYDEENEWWEIGFQKWKPRDSPSSSFRNYENHLTICKKHGKEDAFYLLSISLDGCGFSLSNKIISHIGHLNTSERMILNAYFNSVDIIMDVQDDYEVDTEWEDY